MEKEEDENSRPSPVRPDYSSPPEPAAAAAATPPPAGIDSQLTIPDTGSECGPLAKSDEAQPGESLTPKTEPKAGGEDQDGVAGESGSVGEETRPVEERGEDELSGRGFPPQSGGETELVSPQLVVDEIGGGEVSPIAEESRGIVSPESAMEGVDEKEEPVEEIGGDVTVGKEGDGVVNNSDSAAKEDLEDVSEDADTGVEDNEIGTETGMDVAAHVVEETGKEVEADMMDVKEEETANEEKVMEVEEGSRKEVEAGITDNKEEFKTENVEKKADVVEETATEVDVDMTDIKEGIENMDNANVVEETQNYEEGKGNMEEADQAEAVDVIQDALMAEMAEDADRVLKEVDEVKVEKLEAIDSAGGEQSEEVELENTGVAEELGVTEQTKIEDIAEEAEDTKQMDKAEEMKIVEMADEQDKEGEEVDLADGQEETEIAEEVDKENEVEETEMADDAEAAEEELEEVSKNSGGKRKRGKNAKTPVKGSSRKKTEEDVCFICFDGGNLVLCDRRGCPKAYHASCVNRDDAFFRSKGRWNCGWHLCSNCEKNAYYMCYTCTFSLCKGCIKDNVIFCVRGNKGFCETCMKTVTLIERNEQGSKELSQVDFTDKSSWEYLFKDYFIDLKARLSLTSEEIAQAKNPWKGSDLHAGKQELHDEPLGTQNDGGSGSDSSGNAELPSSKRRKTKKRMKSRAKEKESLGRVRRNRAELKSTDEEAEWASDELLEFVMHMKDGDRSVCSQYDVQALLLEYIKRNKLRDPRRKSQIICDSRLENLFGKPRVGHFEMLKLIESHFLLKEDSQGDELQGSVVNTEANQLEADGNSDALMKSKDKKRRSRKKGDGRGLQSNLDDYAAIDMHNINLIYLKRSLVEDLIEDIETFHEKVVGSFVRLRISGSAQKQDLYRLVQVIGTNKAAERYRVGKKETDYLLEILNLNKSEVVTVDIISNQEFTEDECKRLRQSIKCGLINPLTVGDIQEKALALQAVRVKDSLEAEITRLSHLRDRASDMGRRKELRECVEKLQLLKSPEERQRRLEEIPEIHVDPKMDPSYESEEESETDSKRQENYGRPRGSGFSRRGREPISPREGSFALNDSWGGTRTRELSRSMSNKGFFSRGDDASGVGETVKDEVQQLQSWEKHKAAPEISPVPASADVMQEVVKIDEADKMWQYQDPSGKIQGPFSINQLRKWNTTGYFPPRLRIWRNTEKQQDSILLTDALAGNFHKVPSPLDSNFLKSPLVQSPLPSNAVDMWKPRSEISNTAAQAAPAPVEVPKFATERWGSESNLPSPTPARSASGGIKGQEYESKWSPTPAQPSPSMLGLTSRGGNGQLKHSALVHPGSGQSTNISTPSSSTKQSTQVDGTNMSHTGVLLSSVSALMQSQSTVPVESPRVQVNSHQLQAPNSSGVSVNSAIDVKTLQSLVQSVTNNKPVVGTHGWGGGSVPKPEINASQTTLGTGSEAWGSVLPQKIDPKVPVSTAVHPNAYGNAQSSAHNSTSPFASGNPSGAHHVPGSSGLVPSEPWRAPMHGQSNTQPSNPAGLQWGMGTDNQGATPRHGPENQNSGWGTIPATSNMAWGGQVTGNSNQGWVGPGQAVANAGWVAPGQGQAPGNVNSVWASSVQGQPMGNAFPGWAPSSQGAAPVNANTGWVAPGQGPPPSNSNPSWAAPGGNPGSWGGEKKYNGDRYPGPRDRGSQGGDSAYGGDRSWNRQSSFNRGGDSSRPSYRGGQRVCKFHENGHCKKGAACDYLHT